MQEQSCEGWAWRAGEKTRAKNERTVMGLGPKGVNESN